MTLFEEPYSTFRFADDRIIPRFRLEGVGTGRRVTLFRIDPATGERMTVNHQPRRTNGYLCFGLLLLRWPVPTASVLTTLLVAHHLCRRRERLPVWRL